MNVILSRKSPTSPLGGRPMSLGGLIFDYHSGKRAIFIGYDNEGRKVGITERELENILKKRYLQYRVKIEFEEIKKPREAVKSFIKTLIPKLLKEAIIQDGLDKD